MKTLLIVLFVLAAGMIFYAGVGEYNSVDAIELQRVYGYSWAQAWKMLQDAQIAGKELMMVAFLFLAGAGAIAKYMK